ncbi:hypothetical protein TNIN_99641 [Trichonephila inaurata madagascariensis]|uniref:Uncharacterized protein n=1 Tax=Trichonephila inaurata madagascariensis TaxID=2747483 RepID=A0A8X7C1B7_9ARAC|nr:hypothetical protein TNIN_99641 [Trichonephila inaurata madagascariensis]
MNPTRKGAAMCGERPPLRDQQWCPPSTPLLQRIGDPGVVGPITSTTCLFLTEEKRRPMHSQAVHAFSKLSGRSSISN